MWTRLSLAFYAISSIAVAAQVEPPSHWAGISRRDAEEVHASDFDQMRRPVLVGDAIYSVTYEGDLLRLPLNGDAPTLTHFNAGASSLAVDADGALWVLLQEYLSGNAFVARRTSMTGVYDDDWWVSPPLLLDRKKSARCQEEGAHLISVDGAEIHLVTKCRVASIALGDKRWRDVRLDAPLPLLDARKHVARVVNHRWLWAGTDNGEWYGSLVRIDLERGVAEQMWGDGPITDAVPDPEHAGCVLVSSGLNHMGGELGYLIRGCANDVTASPDFGVPLEALVRSGEHLYAWTAEALVPIVSGQPRFENKVVIRREQRRFFHALPAVLMDDVLLLYAPGSWHGDGHGWPTYAVQLPHGVVPKMLDTPLPKPEPDPQDDSRDAESTD